MKVDIFLAINIFSDKFLGPNSGPLLLTYGRESSFIIEKAHKPDSYTEALD